MFRSFYLYFCLYIRGMLAWASQNLLLLLLVGILPLTEVRAGEYMVGRKKASMGKELLWGRG